MKAMIWHSARIAARQKQGRSLLRTASHGYHFDTQGSTVNEIKKRTNKMEFKAQCLLPNDSWDTHHHIFEPTKFAYSPDRHLTPPEASCVDYESFKRSLGISNSALTHGLSYGDDCTSLKSFIATLGNSCTRGCAVINEDTTDLELRDLHKAGVRGIRLNLYGYGAMNDIGKQKKCLEWYANRVRSKGWFVEFLQLNHSNWAPLGEMIPMLGLNVVTDHHALLKSASMLSEGEKVLSQPGLADIIKLLNSGVFWVKLSAPYRSSTAGPYYEDMRPLVLALVEANPKRVLWGSDWPHTPNMKVRTHEEAMRETPFQKIDDRAWLESLKSWLTEEQWRLLMVTNPGELYGL